MSARWRERLAGPALAALVVACCLAAPALVGGIGAVGAGALFGLGAGVIALLALCLFIAPRLRSQRRC